MDKILFPPLLVMAVKCWLAGITSTYGLTQKYYKGLPRWGVGGKLGHFALGPTLLGA